MKQKNKKTVKKALGKDRQEEFTKLGNRIRSLRIKKGYSSFEQFAYEHDISRAQFGRYEKGEDLRFSSLLKVVKAFDMNLQEFFSEGFE
jgi:transcriptional regulator with XRE-family HTH domain